MNIFDIILGLQDIQDAKASHEKSKTDAPKIRKWRKLVAVVSVIFGLVYILFGLIDSF